MALALDDYRLLGRSGLRVSPLALGTATFGTEWGWGAERAEARKLFDRYVGLGGNLLDTADTYTDGSSERLLGEFAHEERERLVLATKYSTLRRPGDPNSGGGHRKALFGSVEGSLRRLGTDYLDLLYLHVWDFRTSVEEVLRGLDDLVRQGKVLYVAISNTPAWQVSRMQAIADLRGWSPLVALQLEYSLIERTAERDLIPMARELGLGVVPYSPLGGGVLSGKYGRDDVGATGSRPRREHPPEPQPRPGNPHRTQPRRGRGGPGGGRRAGAHSGPGGAGLDAAEPGRDEHAARRPHLRPVGGQPGRPGGRADGRPAGPARRGGRDRPRPAARAAGERADPPGDHGRPADREPPLTRPPHGGSRSPEPRSVHRPGEPRPDRFRVGDGRTGSHSRDQVPTSASRLRNHGSAVWILVTTSSRTGQISRVGTGPPSGGPRS